MNRTLVRKSLALLLLAALAACGANAAGGAIPQSAAPDRAGSVPPVVRTDADGILARFVGVGDSLTAGYQAGGFLGQTGVPNPLKPGTTIAPGQENGWWADVDEEISGLPIDVAIASEYNPATSPLPLIAGPGLDNQLVPATGLAPFNQSKTGDSCTFDGGFDAKGYLLSGLNRVRLNPHPTVLQRDFGVPGITLHEANVLFQPQTNTCKSIPGIPGLLNLITAGESGTFWPVLGNYAAMQRQLSEANAAARVRPTLATVWLGANDVLKYMGSGGRFIGGDQTPDQVAADIRQTVQTLKNAGAKTVVATLPNVLMTPYFMRVTIPKSNAVCNYQTYVYCVLSVVGLGAKAAELTTEIAKAYHLDTPGGCTPLSTTEPCGYLTLQGALQSLAYYLANYPNLPDLDCSGPNFTKPCVPGSGIGTYYITPALAAKIQILNESVNAGIIKGATYTQSGLLDVTTIFDGITSGDPKNPYYAQAISINPGVCCTLSGGGGEAGKADTGLVSFDGLHPSNTGYALIAFYAIKTINARYGTHIREIDVRKAYKGTRCSNPAYCFPDVYAPHGSAAHPQWDAWRDRVHALGLDHR